MAPRTEPAQRSGHRSNHTASERQFLSAHTGAGVNPRRLYTSRGRDVGQTRDIYRPRYHNTQRQHQGRSGVPARGRRRVERPTLNDSRYRVQDQGNQGRAAELHVPRFRGQLQARIDRDDVASFDATNNSHGQAASTRTIRSPVIPEMDSNVRKSSTANPVTPDSTTQPPQQSASFSCPQFTQSRPEFQSPFMPGLPNPSRLHAHPVDCLSDNEDNLPLLPPPLKRPVRPYRGKDEVKRAFTNANLRAIMADKPYPKPRNKTGAEKPTLRMGIRKEYK